MSGFNVSFFSVKPKKKTNDINFLFFYTESATFMNPRSTKNQK